MGSVTTRYVGEASVSVSNVESLNSRISRPKVPTSADKQIQDVGVARLSKAQSRILLAELESEGAEVVFVCGESKNARNLSAH